MMTNNKLQIYGLQAIAVGAVILYHAQISILGHQLFKGGFIGVDIFFVISGYLITSIILKELITTNSFSFKYFYERRIKQIFPVLLLVILASLPFAWFYLLPTELINFSKSIITIFSFSSNFYFHYSGNAFGQLGSLSKPLIHTWLISVLAKYYILFPIILLIVFKYFRKYLIHILIFGFFISLGLADWGSRNYSSFNFYVLPTRGWELLVGSILAYFEINNGHRSKNKTLNLILPSLGLLLIGHSILFFNDEMFHPSFYTLSPIIGVCLIIWFSSKNELITKILSTKLFVGTGLISYSLYLWHYPIFAFARITEFTQGSLFKKLLLGIVIIIPSIFSYYLIERPARNKSNKFKFFISLILISISVLVIVNVNIVKKDGYKERLPDILQNNLQRHWNLLKNLEEENCFSNADGCSFNISSNKKVYIIGDSLMASLMFNLKDRVVKSNYQFITSTISWCLFYPSFNLVNVETNKVNENCSDNYFQKLKEILSKDKNSIIIFGGTLPIHLSNYYFDDKEGGVEGEKWSRKYLSLGKYDTIQNSFKREVSDLSENNKIILMYPIPEVGWDPNKKIYNQWVKQKFTKNFNLINVTTSYEVYKDRAKSSFELLDSIQGDNIYRVYPHTLFCNTTIKNRCVTHDDKNIFYADTTHPSLKGAEMINDLIMKEIKKIELKSN